MNVATFLWDGLDAAAVGRRCGLANVWLYAEVDSTQDVAHARAEAGAPAGSLIVADMQRSGRGRHGRRWTSQPGRGVWCTILERPRDPRALDVLSIRVGLRVADTCDGFAGERVGVKWPNDLRARRGKLGGILSEARWTGASLAWVAVGVGINVIAPSEVNGAAALLDGVKRIDVLRAVVGAVRSAASSGGLLSDAELRDYRSRDALAGCRIVSPAIGTVAGIAADGALVVQTERGEERHRAGTIRLAEDA